MVVDSIVIVRDDGLGDRNPRFAIGTGRWVLAHGGLEGFDGVDVDVSVTQYAQYAGGRVTGERIASADRTISAIGLGEPASLRSEAERFFADGAGYEVHVTSGERRRMSLARSMGARLATDNATGHQLLEWTFLSPDPLWLDEDERGFDIAEASGCLGFPFMSLSTPFAIQPQGDEPGGGEAGLRASGDGGWTEPIVAGFVCGVLSHRIDLTNEGSSDAYPRFVIAATGHVSRPSIAIYNAAGDDVCHFGVETDMEEGDELVIDFSARPTRIELNGSNVSHLASAGSTLAVGIAPGAYSLEWSAGDGDAAMSVRPFIRDRYSTI